MIISKYYTCLSEIDTKTYFHIRGPSCLIYKWKPLINNNSDKDGHVGRTFLKFIEDISAYLILLISINDTSMFIIDLDVYIIMYAEKTPSLPRSGAIGSAPVHVCAAIRN